MGEIILLLPNITGEILREQLYSQYLLIAQFNPTIILLFPWQDLDNHEFYNVYKVYKHKV